MKYTALLQQQLRRKANSAISESVTETAASVFVTQVIGRYVTHAVCNTGYTRRELVRLRQSVHLARRNHTELGLHAASITPSAFSYATVSYFLHTAAEARLATAQCCRYNRSLPTAPQPTIPTQHCTERPNPTHSYDSCTLQRTIMPKSTEDVQHYQMETDTYIVSWGRRTRRIHEARFLELRNNARGRQRRPLTCASTSPSQQGGGLQPTASPHRALPQLRPAATSDQALPCQRQ